MTTTDMSAESAKRKILARLLQEAAKARKVFDQETAGGVLRALSGSALSQSVSKVSTLETLSSFQH